jgi:Ca-activated chloride channel family protein
MLRVAGEHRPKETDMTTIPIRILAGFLCLSPLAPAAQEQRCAQPAEQTAGPATAAALEIVSHEVTVLIQDGFATTRVEEVLANPLDVVADATWAFPLPEEASLSELSTTIDEKLAIGEVVEKQKGREIFEEEKAAGEDAALAEQDSYREYRISLARIPPRGTAAVRIVYYQPIDIEAGVGRYLYPLQEGHTSDDMSESFWTMDKSVHGKLAFDVIVQTSFPVDALHSPSHPSLTVDRIDEGTWHAHYEAQDARLDQDFVLLYRLAADLPARIELLTHRAPGAAEGTYMVVVTPGSDLAPVEGGTDWAFVLDVSGSMQGDKIRLLRRGVAKAIAELGPDDRFQVVAFAQRAQRMTGAWVNARTGEAAAVATEVEHLEAAGGTNVFAALEEAYGELEADRPTAVVLVSDGAANLGPHEYRDFLALQRKHDVRLFTFVMGNGANERLLGDLATCSGGFAKSISMQDEVGAHLMLARDRMSHVAMHGLELDLAGSTVRHPERLPSLYIGQQLVALGRYEKAGPSEIAVRARISGEPREWRVPVELPAVDDSNPELERLYALAAIADLEREQWLAETSESEMRSAIVDMAVRYSLVTDYTSMIVVSEDRKSLHGIGEDNARRSADESAAAARRRATGPTVQLATGGDPLAGSRAAHAPSRYSSGGGGGMGAGAVDPLTLAPLAALAWIGVRARRKRGA